MSEKEIETVYISPSFESFGIKGNEDMEPQHTQLKISFLSLRRTMHVRRKKKTAESRNEGHYTKKEIMPSFCHLMN